MLTQQQIAQEKSNEARLNNLSEQVIGQTAWGKFYGLMRGAAAAGEGLIPHQVCLSKDGREVTVYNSNAGKVVGAFLKPTHEVIAKYISQKDYGSAIASFFGAGQFLSVQEQLNATCLNITPQDVINLVRNTSIYDPNTGLPIPMPSTNTIPQIPKNFLKDFEDRVVHIFTIGPNTTNKLNNFFSFFNKK